MAKYAVRITGIRTNLGPASLVVSTHDLLDDANVEALSKVKPTNMKDTMKDKFKRDWPLDYSKREVVQLLELPSKPDKEIKEKT